MERATQNSISGWECAKCGIPLLISNTGKIGPCAECGNDGMTPSFVIGD
jgi:uncharacterized Zn finger protein (UPF0148 family)